MMMSEAFRHKLREYLRQVGYQQQDLAARLGFSVGILSRKLNQTDKKFLTDPEVRQIVKILAEWQAFESRAEPVELLELAGLSEASFGPAEWGAPPLADLKAAAKPAPKAAEPVNLPAQLTNLVGREAEIADLTELLARPGLRLLTLTGPGGVGKTRLAIEVARRLAANFAEGVYFVALDNITESSLVAFGLAQALGLKESGSQPLLDTLKAFLADRQSLLVLDNFEHLVAAAGLVNELLRAAPGLKILVTSRAVLHLYGECEFDVPPLPVPEIEAASSLAELSQSAAISLFVQGAASVRPAFRLDAQSGPVVAQICKRLDGLPLAIELAAARVKLFTPQTILNRLTATPRLKELANGARDLPPRQQSLRTAIDWSYDALSAEGQRLFRRLAVFVGGCTVEAVEQVCEVADGFEGLVGLLDNSLIKKADGPEGEPVFSMLETIREYALERLSEAGEADELSRRHLTYHLALAEAARSYLQGGPAQLDWLNRLDREHNNFRAALTFALRDPSIPDETRLRLGCVLYSFWIKRSHLSEGRQWLEAILAASPVEPSDPTLLQLQAEVMLGAGTLAYLQGDYARARLLHEEGIRLRRELGDRRGLLGALNNAAVLENVAGDHARAGQLLQESLVIARELNDKPRLTASLINLGALAAGEGDTARASALYEESLALSQETGDRHYRAIALNNLGEIACQQGDYPRAKKLLDERLAMGREMGDKQGIANALYNLGILAYLQNDWSPAYTLCRQSLDLWQAIEARFGQAVVTNLLGAISYRQADYPAAIGWFEQSLTLSQSIQDKKGQSYSLIGLAAIAARTGQPEQAVRHLAASQRGRESAGPGRDPIYQQLYQETLDLAHTALTPAQFDALWQSTLAEPASV